MSEPSPQEHPRSAVALSSLAPGDCAEVETVTGDGPVARRLRDLGFLPGTRVLSLRRAPLGDPTVYELRGTRLCLRDAEAARVRVVPAVPARG